MTVAPDRIDLPAVDESLEIDRGFPTTNDDGIEPIEEIRPCRERLIASQRGCPAELIFGAQR